MVPAPALHIIKHVRLLRAPVDGVWIADVSHHSMRLLAELRHHVDAVTALAAPHGAVRGDLLVSGSRDGAVTVWEVDVLSGGTLLGCSSKVVHVRVPLLRLKAPSVLTVRAWLMAPLAVSYRLRRLLCGGVRTSALRTGAVAG